MNTDIHALALQYRARSDGSDFPLIWLDDLASDTTRLAVALEVIEAMRLELEDQDEDADDDINGLQAEASRLADQVVDLTAKLKVSKAARKTLAEEVSALKTTVDELRATLFLEG
jgi:chromosome segregation ATPase